MTNTTTVARKVLDLLSNMARLYPSSGLSLFCVLTYTALAQLKIIELKLEQFLPNNQQTNRPKADEIEKRHSKVELKILMRQHSLVCQTVQLISDTFGFFLLLEIFFIFVVVIGHCMFMLVAFLIRDWEQFALTAAIVVDQISRLVTITFISDALPKQVGYTIFLIFFVYK
jgi:cytochrome c oxidase subunit IV